MPLPQEINSKTVDDRGGTHFLLTARPQQRGGSVLVLDIRGHRAFFGNASRPVGMGKVIGGPEEMGYLAGSIQNALQLPVLVHFRETGQVEDFEHRFEHRVYINNHRLEAFRIGFRNEEFYISVKNTYARHRLRLYEPIQTLQSLLDSIDEISVDILEEQI